MTKPPPHDAGRQAVETARIYRDRRVAERQAGEKLAAQAREQRAAKQAQ